MRTESLILIIIFIFSFNARSQSIKVKDTEFSKGKIGHVQIIEIDDVVKFHGHRCDGLVEGFRALQEALFYLYPEGIVDRTNTRIISKSTPCLSDAAIYLTGGRYQYNRFYVDDKMDAMYYVQRIDNGNAVYVKRKDDVKPKVIDSLNALALKGELAPCELRKLKLYEDDYTGKLLATNTWDLFDLYVPTKKTIRNWKPNKKNDYPKTDILFKNTKECDVNEATHKNLFLSLPPTEFNKAIISPGNMVIDVRTPSELRETGFIRNAINVDYQNDNFEQRLSNFDRNKTYFVYCRSGKRSFAAMEIMQKMGFTKLVMLEGGILEWNAQNMPFYKF